MIRATALATVESEVISKPNPNHRVPGNSADLGCYLRCTVSLLS